MGNKLEEAREIINEVDAQMAELFVRRMHAAEMIYEHKKEFGLPILDAKREAAVIEKNSARVENEVLKGYYVDYLKNLMAVSRAYQYRLQSGLKVAYSGVEGAFAHIAAGRIFPESNRISCRDFRAAYDAVLHGDCDVAVLPIENGCAGEVGQTIDLIFAGTLSINGIYEMEIHQNLLGVPGAKAEDTRKGTSLADLQPNINQSSENTTRFAVLSKVRAASPALTSSVLMFTVKNEAGSLANAISIIGKYGYNMTALRSRPLRKHACQDYFYIEIDGTTDSDEGQKMLEELSGSCDQLKVVGSFAPHAQI